MNQTPLVSVIIPGHNAEAALERVFNAVQSSTYKNFELLYVDDCSTDISRDIARRFTGNVLEIRSRCGPAAARNAGAKAAKGEVLFFIDADVEIRPDTLSFAVKALQQDAALGGLFGSYDDEPACPGTLSQFKNLFHHFVHQHASEIASTFWSGCGAMRRDVFLALGGFPETDTRPSIEDVALGYEAHARGINLKLMKNLQVKHLKSWSLASLVTSDIAGRAIPWSRLAAERGLPRDLNFKTADRLSGALACVLVLSLCLALFSSSWLFPAVLLASTLSYLNRTLYLFLFRKRGLRFLAAAVFLHWAYLFYSTVTFAAAWPYYRIKKASRELLYRRSERT